MKKRLDNLINDYIYRAPMPDTETLSAAKKALAEARPAPFYSRRWIRSSCAAVVVLALFVVSALFLGVFPVETIRAENKALEIYVEKTFPKDMLYEITDCLDVKRGETAVGAIINILVSHDSDSVSDELRIIIEYSAKVKLADSAFDETVLSPRQSIDERIKINACGSLPYEDFLTRATFSDGNVRVCVEIISKVESAAVYRDNVEVYMAIFSQWPPLAAGLQR